MFLTKYVDVPYIANWIYEHSGLDLNLKGIWIADPTLTYGVIQQDLPALRFILVSRAPLYLNETKTVALFLYSGASFSLPF